MDVEAAVQELLPPGRGRPPLHQVHTRWCAYPVAPTAWCRQDGLGQPREHHDPDLFILVNGGLRGEAPPDTPLPDYPRQGSRIYLVDVSICTQADLRRRYQAKRQQLAWLATWIGMLGIAPDRNGPSCL